MLGKILPYGIIIFLIGIRIAYSQILNNTITNSQTICSGDSTNITGSLPTGCSGIYQFQWETSSDSLTWSPAQIQTQGIQILFFSPQILYFRRIVTNPNCPVDTSNVVQIYVIPPIGNNIPGQNQWLCTGMQPQAFTGSLPTGGSGIYQYTWLSSSDSLNWVNTGLTQQNLTPLLSGWYRRIVQGGICLSDTSLTVQAIINPPISQNLIGSDQSICQGSTPALLTGSAPSGAFGQYQYTWESSLNLSTWLPVSGGTQMNLQASILNQSFYFRRIVNSSVCSDTAMPVLILTNNPLSANQIGIDQTICAGSTPQSIMGTVPQGGSGIYDYQWESSLDSVNWVTLTGETQQGLQPAALSTHTYFRRLVNSAPCTSIPSNAVIVYTEPQIGNNTILQAQTICIGTAFQQISGSLPSGGDTQYQYTWQSSLTQNNWQTITGATQQDLSGYIPLQATYLRRVVSAGACTGNNSGTIRISLQARPGYNLLSSQQNLCSGPGSFQFTGTQPNGGTGSFQYSWEISPDSLSWTSIPGATQVSYSGSIPWTTSYLRRIVTSGICPPDTAGGMLVLIDSVVGNNLIGSSQTICAGTQPLLLSGSIPSGSVSPPIYLWQESTDSLNWSNASGAFTLQTYQPPILQGNYYYRRIASRGACLADTTLLLSMNVEPVPGANSLVPDQTICLGTAAALLSGSTPTGGNGVFLFSWESSSDAQNWNAITGASQQNFAPGLLPATTYYRRWIYSGVCPPLVSASLIVRVESPPLPNIISATHTLCSGNNGQWLTGSLPGGGNGQYQYQWQSSPDQLNWQNLPQAIQADYAPGVLNQTLFYRRVLSSGVCAGNTSNEVKITVFPTPDIQVIGLDLCLGMGGYLQAQSSYPGGVWNWSTGGQAAQEWVQPSVFTTYSVSYTLGGCTSAVLQTAVRVFPATVATLNPSGQVPLCPGASLTLTAGGGFQFEWPGHLNYQNELTLTTAGTYTVIVTDINGCKDTATTLVYAVPPLQVQFFVQPPNCHNTLDGFTTVVVNGGLPPYTYTWNTTPTISTSSLTGLNQGSYQVNVQDAAGCEVIRTVVINPPLPLSIQASGSPVPCSPAGNAGTAWVTASGGTAPYYYLWATSPSQTSATAVGLSAGSYSVSVTDSKGCVTTGMAVLQTEPTPTVLTSPDTFVCAGAGGIGIQANASGGIPPYIYYWSQSAWVVSGSISDINSPTPTVNPDTSGWYQVTVTGNNGCTSIADSVYIEVMPLPIADAGMDQFFCEGAPGVFLVGNIPNANGPYSVQWSPSTGLFCDTCLTTYALPTVATIYTLRVTNTQTGCSSDSTTLNSLSTAVVSILSRPVVSAGRDTAICLGDIAQLAGSASGAGPQYSWHWSPALGLNDSTLQMPWASPPHSMIYSLSIVSNGCESQSDSVLLSVIPVPVVSAGTVLNICRGDSIQLPAILQQGMATVFSWSPAAGLNDSTLLNPMASPNTNTVYKLQAYHQGCTGLPDSVPVIVHDVPIAEAGSGFLFCANGDSVSLNGSFTGGSVPVRYSWSPAYGLNRTDVLSPRCLPDSSMMYYLRVASGVAPTECSTYDSVMVTIVPGLTAEILPPDTNIICQGQLMYLQATGGIGSASFQWWPASGLSDTQSGSVYATPQGDTRYYVAVSEGGCTDTAFVDLFVHPTPEASFSISQAYGCAPLDIYTQNLSSHTLAFEWKVSPGNFYSNEREPKISFPSSGVYSITLIARAPGACADTLTLPLPITIIDNINPIVYSEPQFPVRLTLPHTPVSFVDSTEDAVEWMWDFGDGHNSRERKTSHAWQKPGTYYVTLQVNNLYGCPGLLTLGPYILEEPALFIPNVFSPDGDGIHDRFNIEYSGDETFVLKIVDRWGVSLFETFNKEQGWDGRNLQGQELDAGVYFYHCQIGKKAYSGSVTMMR